MGEWRYKTTFFLPLYHLEVSGQLHAPAALPLGKELKVPIELAAMFSTGIFRDANIHIYIYIYIYIGFIRYSIRFMFL
jgi:hypothetical protein